eukprot:1021758-Pleurochrysis_carterae.AAC.1
MKACIRWVRSQGTGVEVNGDGGTKLFRGCRGRTGASCGMEGGLMGHQSQRRRSGQRLMLCKAHEQMLRQREGSGKGRGS